jgi:S1-C subfamily serine protease
MRTPITIVSVVAAAALAVAGCGSSSADKSATSGKAAAPPDPSKAVVYVQGIYPDKKTEVTGVVYEATQGLVLTANHAIEGAPSINVRLGNGRVVHARAAARAQCHDMAILKLFPKPAGLVALPLGDSSSAAVGEPVSTYTYLLQGDGATPALTRIQGTLSAVGVRERFPPLPVTGPFLAHQTSLLAPASGSPLVNAKGEMIGLNTFVGHPRDPDVPGIEYGLTSGYITKRLQELRPGVGGALGGWGAEHNACHATLAKLLGLGHSHDPGAAGAKAPKNGSTTTTTPGSGGGSGSGTGGGGGNDSGSGSS